MRDAGDGTGCESIDERGMSDASDGTSSEAVLAWLDAILKRDSKYAGPENSLCNL